MPDQSHVPQCEIVTAVETMVRLNEAIAEAAMDRKKLSAVLCTMLDIFHCDRAWLLYPADAASGIYRAVMEETRPAWPGALSQGATLAADERYREVLDRCLGMSEPVAVLADPQAYHQVEAKFNVQSQLMMAVRPREDLPWLLGIHHCEGPRLYDTAMPLFYTIGTRIADALSMYQTTNELRQSQERFRAIVDYAPDAIVILDAETGIFTDANPRAEELYGMSRAEFLNKLGPVDFSPERQPDGRPSAEAARAHIRAAVAGGFPVFEWMHRKASGELVPCEISLVHMPHETRQLVRGSMQDITIRKQAERERAELEAQLAQAQKLEAVGQLTGGIAHDFNNLLTVILGNLELAAQFHDDAAQVEDSVSQARVAAERARALTQRLLAFSRQQPLQPRALDVADLIHNMEEMLRPSLGEEIEIAIRTDTDLWPCEVDPAQLESAILNLCLNARDAMPGGGRLTVAAANAEISADDESITSEIEPGHYVAVTITDTGTGMTPDVLANVFAPFFTTKDVGKGSGLGLSMVYGFARQSGGGVSAGSVLGEGTSISIYLPRAVHESQAETSATNPARHGHGEYILVVEDDSAVRKLTRYMLERLGYRVIAAEEAAAALAIVEKEQGIELLFTDVVLPGGINGVELAQQARELRPGMKVLFTSGYTANALAQGGRLKDGVNLLEKPFTLAGLASRIRQALDERV